MTTTDSVDPESLTPTVRDSRLHGEHIHIGVHLPSLRSGKDACPARKARKTRWQLRRTPTVVRSELNITEIETVTEPEEPTVGILPAKTTNLPLAGVPFHYWLLAALVTNCRQRIKATPGGTESPKIAAHESTPCCPHCLAGYHLSILYVNSRIALLRKY